MKKSRAIVWLVVALGLIILGELGAARWQRAELNRLRAALADPNWGGFPVRLGNSEAQLREQARHIRLARDKAGEISRREAGIRPPPAVHTGFLTRFGRAMRNPEMVRLLAEQQRQLLPVFYGPLFSRLGLRAEDLDRFEELLVRRQQMKEDNRAVARDSNFEMGTEGATIEKVVAVDQAAIDGEIASLLGPPGDAEFHRYESSMGVRGVADQLSQALSYTGSPIAPDQKENLVQALFGAQQSGNRHQSTGLNALVGSGMAAPNFTANLSEAQMQSAAAVLSQSQFAALQKIRAAQNAARELSRTEGLKQ